MHVGMRESISTKARLDFENYFYGCVTVCEVFNSGGKNPATGLVAILFATTGEIVALFCMKLSRVINWFKLLLSKLAICVSVTAKSWSEFMRLSNGAI